MYIMSFKYKFPQFTKNVEAKRIGVRIKALKKQRAAEDGKRNGNLEKWYMEEFKFPSATSNLVFLKHFNDYIVYYIQFKQMNCN